MRDGPEAQTGTGPAPAGASASTVPGAEAPAALETAATPVRPARPPRWWKRQVLLHAYVGETLVLVGLLAVVNLAFMPARPGFLGIEPNPFWIPILLMVARYGFRAGLLSSLLAAVVYMALLSARVRGQVLGYADLFTWEYAKPAVLFIIGGVVLGMLVQRHRDQARRLQRELEALGLENQKLRRGEEELRDVNEELASRVVGATETLPMLYKYAKKLNDLDINQIYLALTELVVDVIHSTRCAVYRLEGGRLLQHSLNGQPARSAIELGLEPEVLERLLGRREVVTLHDLLALGVRRQDLFLCGPLSAGTAGKVMAVLAVQEMEFLRYNPATVRLFSVIVDWASASLEKAAHLSDHPEALRIEEAKASILRAEDSARAPELPVFVDDERPTERQLIREATLSTRSVGQATVGADLSRTDLSRVLDDASRRLFGQGSGGQVEPPPPVADPSPSRERLQHLLSGELRIASTHGRPLAKLLAEIDGYLSGQARRS